MSDKRQDAVGAFLDAWIPEFEKSLEMFTGHTVPVKRGGDIGGEGTLQPAGEILWNKQVLECEASGAVWIGIAADACSQLTASTAPEPSDREPLYRELLKQSLEGAAHILSTGRSQRIVCSMHAPEGGAPPSDSPIMPLAWLAIEDREPIPAPILVWLDTALTELLVGKEQPLPGPPSENREETSSLERLADLELPVAVVLGRAALKIQEVLKLTAGSLVELDRRAGEAVEIVVHNVVVARGEVVSVSGNYGVRILEVISHKDRFAIQATAASRLPRMLPKAAIN
ncbi:MAG TPA: FliM/FliN family flagellar motor switch protein [Bryobacteraceae bacterium]|jgi:flagellar motor switch protein FliN/FliY